MEKIEKKVTINVPVEKVWRALTEPDKLGEWMKMSTTFEPVAGKDFTFKTTASEKWDGIIYCKVSEIEINRKLAFTWNPGIDADTLVTILISDNNGQTDVSLTHTGWEQLPAEMRPQLMKDHNSGWDERINGTLPGMFS